MYIERDIVPLSIKRKFQCDGRKGKNKIKIFNPPSFRNARERETKKKRFSSNPARLI
jgi:hypothetical protein